MSESFLSFHKTPAATGALYAWRRELAERDRGGRARLRRCASPLDAEFVPAFHRLLPRIEAAFDRPLGGAERTRLAALAALIARLPEEEATGSKKRPSLATQFGTGAEGARDQPRLHPLRFRRLLEAEDLDERFLQLRRALDQLGTEVDLADLADGVFRWDERTRREWAYHYYAAFSPKGVS